MIDEQRLQKFFALRPAIKDVLKWRSAGPVRDAVALAALDLDGAPEEIAARLREPADILKQNHSKLQLLRQPVRYAIAAVLLRQNIDPLLLTQSIADSRERWKQVGLRRGAPYEGASHLILHLGTDGSEQLPFLNALKNAFDDLNRRRWWHVGARTLPPLALALQYRSDAASAADQMYGAMEEEKGLHGRHTMEAALMATLSPGYPAETARQIAALRGALKDRKIPDAPANITGLAFANLTDPDPNDFADAVQAMRERFKQEKFGSTNRALLALDYVTAERFRTSGLPQAKIAPILMAVQAYQLVLQQQAAMVAVIAGSAATTAN
ncbi:hypothetical protein [Aquisalinus flavus]|uniref:DUF4003 domain-containing protein n=1 Tax=Aquisalinus flavus TaxID=1526572 RepID=A0A8J2V763_9PROT|nr:hypothetical protein [Aquisalinus flavus]MBD0427556.1 hypothetical protein [Aquisalinus flavus]UNE47348.1 hypothetical protein FF099_04370 [Aquisalinus flavus]GGD01902.1 hypothetical protein GCM10011342_08690 [Aquisalinus flavus]